MIYQSYRSSDILSFIHQSSIDPIRISSVSITQLFFSWLSRPALGMLANPSPHSSLWGLETREASKVVHKSWGLVRPRKSWILGRDGDTVSKTANEPNSGSGTATSQATPFPSLPQLGATLVRIRGAVVSAPPMQRALSPSTNGGLLRLSKALSGSPENYCTFPLLIPLSGYRSGSRTSPQRCLRFTIASISPHASSETRDQGLVISRILGQLRGALKVGNYQLTAP